MAISASQRTSFHKRVVDNVAQPLNGMLVMFIVTDITMMVCSYILDLVNVAIKHGRKHRYAREVNRVAVSHLSVIFYRLGCQR